MWREYLAPVVYAGVAILLISAIVLNFVWLRTPPKFRIVIATVTGCYHVMYSRFGLFWKFLETEYGCKSSYDSEAKAYAQCDEQRKFWHRTRAKKTQKYVVLRELDSAHPFTEHHNGHELR